MKSIHLLPLIFSLALCACESPGSVADGTPIPGTTVAPLMSWVERATGTPIAVAPIVVASTSDLRTTLDMDDANHAGAVAAYTPGRITISNTIWNSESVVSQSYLVHELVHHAQLLSHKTYACHHAKEREAYTLQNRWLAEHGQGPVVSQGWIDRLSSCERS